MMTEPSTLVSVWIQRLMGYVRDLLCKYEFPDPNDHSGPRGTSPKQ